MVLLLACILLCKLISLSESARFSHIYRAPYGANSMSTKPDITLLKALPRIKCAQMCNTIYGCGGFNYRIASAGLLQCELKQGTTNVRMVHNMQNVTYYEKKEQDLSIVSGDCVDLQNSGVTASGVYQVNLNPAGNVPELTDVYCDMDTDNGGWLVLIKREDGSVNFDRDWSAYRNGFGMKTGEHWLGLENMHQITNNGKPYKLRVDIMLFNGDSYYAKYETFTVGPEAGGYILHLDQYTGNAGDALAYHDNQRFSTYDVDTDLADAPSCATLYHCGFWFKAGSDARPTGLYGETVEDTYIDEALYKQGILWKSDLEFIHPKYIDMKITP